MPTQGNFLAALLTVIFGFFFVTVSSRITGLIGTSSNPISGMTIATLILTCTIFVAVGWTGDVYAPVALCVGAIVCIAAAQAGGTSQDLKTGFIVGATPIYQQIGLIIGVLSSSLVIGLTTLYLHNVMTVGSQALPAPQATLMATIIKGLLAQNLPWGSCSSACSSRSRSSCAAFIRSRLPSAPICRLRQPLRSSPAASCGRIVERRTGVKEESEIGSGTLFSSGLIAGGSLAGILYAVLFGRNVIRDADSVDGDDPLHSRRDVRHDRGRAPLRGARSDSRKSGAEETHVVGVLTCQWRGC